MVFKISSRETRTVGNSIAHLQPVCSHEPDGPRIYLYSRHVHGKACIRTRVHLDGWRINIDLKVLSISRSNRNLCGETLSNEPISFARNALAVTHHYLAICFRSLTNASRISPIFHAAVFRDGAYARDSQFAGMSTRDVRVSEGTLAFLIR